MYNELIVLYTANYNLKADYFFGISYLLEKDIKVEFWNLSEIHIKEKYPKIPLPKGLIERDIHSNREFDILIKQNSEALFATPIGFARETFSICRILSRNNVKLLYGNFGLIPYNDSFIEGRCNHFNFSEITDKIKFKNVSWLIKKILFKTSLFRPATYLLKSSKLATGCYKIDQSTIVLNGSSSDFLNFKTSERNVNTLRPYIVFIDQNIAYHPENGKMIGDICKDPKGYFIRMNNLFDTIEKLKSCDIIICAHPSSVRYKSENPFNGRKIEYGKTQEYVKEALGVITHNSTALSFAVLYNKPVLLVTTNDIENNMPYGAHIITNFKKLLGCAYVNLDKLEGNDYTSFNSIDENKYKEYVENFLSLNSEKTNGEVIFELFV